MNKRRKFSATWVLAILVGALAAYTFYEYRQAAEDGGMAENERRAFDFKPEQVRELKITRGATVERFLKDGANWRMKEPVEDLAETSSVDGFLWGLVGQRLATFRDEESRGISWSEFGLEQPAMRLDVTTQDGRTQSLAIGTKNAFDGSFYVRQGDELFLTDPGLAHIKDRPAGALRSRRLWRGVEVPVESAEVVFSGRGGLSYKITKQDGKWVIEPKPPFSVSDEKVESWIDALRIFSPADIVSEDAANAPPAIFKVTLNFKRDGKPAAWTLSMNSESASGTVLVHSTSRPTLYRAGDSAVARLRVTPEYFRDGRAPFAIPVEQVRSVEIRAGELRRTFVRDDGVWSLAPVSKARGESPDVGDWELDGDRLVTLMQTVSGLDAAEFLPRAPASSGIGEPQFVARDKDGETLFELAWGREYKAREAFNRSSALIYTKTNLEKEVMGVVKERLDKLIDPTIIKRRSPKK